MIEIFYYSMQLERGAALFVMVNHGTNQWFSFKANDETGEVTGLGSGSCIDNVWLLELVKDANKHAQTGDPTFWRRITLKQFLDTLWT